MSKILTAWNPEDAAQWTGGARDIARRNLWISIPALFLAFAVWMVWSAIVVKLPRIGFTFTTEQLFWLTALPGGWRCWARQTASRCCCGSPSMAAAVPAFSTGSS